MKKNNLNMSTGKKKKKKKINSNPSQVRTLSS